MKPEDIFITEEDIQEAKDKAFPIPAGGRCLECACGAGGFERGARWAISEMKGRVLNPNLENNSTKEYKHIRINLPWIEVEDKYEEPTGTYIININDISSVYDREGTVYTTGVRTKHGECITNISKESLSELKDFLLSHKIDSGESSLDSLCFGMLDKFIDDLCNNNGYGPIPVMNYLTETLNYTKTEADDIVKLLRKHLKTKV